MIFLSDTASISIWHHLQKLFGTSYSTKYNVINKCFKVF